MHRRPSDGAPGPPSFHSEQAPRGFFPGVYDSPPPSANPRAHSYFQSVSRSTPVTRPQPFEARAFEPAPPGRYTVEEHHDDVPAAAWRSAADKELEDLLASYQLPDPSSPHYATRRPLHGTSPAQNPNYFSTSATLQRRLLASPPPPVFTAERPHVERITYSKPGYPLVEISSPKRTHSLPAHEYFYEPQRREENTFQAPPSSLSTSFYEPSSLRYSQPSPVYRNPVDRSTLYTPPPPRREPSPPREHRFQPIDVSSLDAFLDDAMSKSTNGWRSTFSSMRDRFGSKDDLGLDEPPSHSFATNGSLTLPRTSPSGFLKKSASSGHMETRNSLLGSAVERKAQEAPELRRPVVKKELSNFWMDTVRRRPDSPTVNRIPSALTAAERLEQLHEPVDAGTSREGPVHHHSNGFSPGAPVRRMTTESVASRRAAYQQNGFSTLPNFSDLDSAMAELRRPARGLGRFPTGELGAFSPPARRNFFGGRGNIFSSSPPPQPHSPSPDTLSQASSTYQSLSGLPHPKPKHNIREQLLNAGLGSAVYGPYPGRLGGNRTISTAPNFPAPTSGSVASRISALEKRPGTPNLLQLACVLNGSAPESAPSPRSPMSPRSTVYRTKNVIQVDIGNRSPKHSDKANGHHDVFDFSEVGATDVCLRMVLVSLYRCKRFITL
uniref:Dynamin-binding protein n=1 Tax=Steinernema glaseri TaxID=37863 RepID=A0A1I7ZZS0_9BILA